jgi:uncharacterized protein YbjT (DUF2867 family)
MMRTGLLGQAVCAQLDDVTTIATKRVAARPDIDWARSLFEDENERIFDLFRLE